MTWIHKQLKNLSRMRLALALLCVFCLVGWPHASSAQNTNIKVGDATLEEFMAAFANAFENAHYIQVDTGNLTFSTGTQNVGTDVDPNRLPVLGFLPTPDGPVLFVPTIPTTPSGVSYDNFLTNVVQYFAHMPDIVVSNVFDKLDVFIDGVYQSSPSDSMSEPILLSSLADVLYNASSEYISDKDLYAAGFGSLVNTFGSDGSHFVIDASDASFANPPNGDVVQVFDWWVGSIVSDMRNQLDGLSNQLAKVVQLGSTSQEIAIEDGSMDDLVNKIGDKFSDLEYVDPFANTNRVGQYLDSLQTLQSNDAVNLGNVLTNANLRAQSLSNSVADNVGYLMRDFSNVVNVLSFSDFRGNGTATVLTLTPTLDLGSALQVEGIKVDLDDERFHIGARSVWSLVHSFFVLSWLVWWFIWMYHYLRHWLFKFSDAVGDR